MELVLAALCALVITSLGFSGMAHGAEYRRLTLSDGRSFVGTIQDNTPDGMVVGLPQGSMVVPFTQVVGMDAATESEYLAQEPWRVLVMPFLARDESLNEHAEALTEQFIGLLEHIPAIRARSLEAMESRLSAEQRATLVACGIDISCMLPYGLEAGANLLVIGALDDEELLLATGHSNAPRSQRQMSVTLNQDTNNDVLLRSLHLSLGLLAPAGFTVQDPEPVAVAVAEAPHTPVVTRKERPPAEAQEWMAWIPVPGVTAIANRDLGAFATSWLVVVPSTVAMVGVAGTATFTRGQFAALSLLSYYGVTVAVNRAIGLHAGHGSLTAVPMAFPANQGLSPSGSDTHAIGLQVTGTLP